MEVNLPFSLCFTLYLRTTSKYNPPGGLYLEGDLTEGFLRYEFRGLIFGGAYTHGGAYFRNFTVCAAEQNMVLVRAYNFGPEVV